MSQLSFRQMCRSWSAGAEPLVDITLSYYLNKSQLNVSFFNLSAQSFLMDRFHLQRLKPLKKTCSRLKETSPKRFPTSLKSKSWFPQQQMTQRPQQPPVCLHHPNNLSDSLWESEVRLLCNSLTWSNEARPDLETASLQEEPTCSDATWTRSEGRNAFFVFFSGYRIWNSYLKASIHVWVHWR